MKQVMDEGGFPNPAIGIQRDVLAIPHSIDHPVRFILAVAKECRTFITFDQKRIHLFILHKGNYIYFVTQVALRIMRN
jgi:hypothetical protein